MYRSINLATDLTFSAISETENLGADGWFWTDDNAKVLEFLCRPEVWKKFPHETTEIVKFVRSMCFGPFIFRRISAPQLNLTGKEGNVISYRHSLMQLKHNTLSGDIAAGIRFHDERNTDNLTFSGNYVEFTYRARRFKIMIENFVSAIKSDINNNNLKLQQVADLHFTYFWTSIYLGRIIYTYEVDTRSMLIAIAASLHLDPVIQVSDVVIAIGHSNLQNCDFRNIVTDSGTALFATSTSRKILRESLGASYYSIRPDQISGDSVALHSIPRDPAQLSGLEAVRGSGGRLHRVAARYAFPGTQRGSRLLAAEYKLLTAGGFYDRVGDYFRLMRDAIKAQASQQAAYDFSISYDYGVVINAFAKCFASCALGGVGRDPRIEEEDLRSLVDTYIGFYFDLYVDRHHWQPNTIFSRELAFVILAVVTMYRVTQATDYLRRLKRLCDVLLEFELRFDAISNQPASGFLMRMDSPRVAFVDCHSAALLALTQAARYISDPRLAAAIDRGLESFCVETCRYDGGIVDTIAALTVDAEGVRRTENGFWNFKVGLTLRFFAALRNAVDPALRAIAARHRERMELLELIMRRQLERSVTEHEDGVEIRCSALSGETNSESQPWIMLGLIGHPYD